MSLIERKANLLDALFDGIVVDEDIARMTPCTCIEYKAGKYLCWSEGVIGALSDIQERFYCNPRVIKKGKIPERIRAFIECSEKYKGVPLEERLRGISECLKKKGIKI